VTIEIDLIQKDRFVFTTRT